MLAKVDQTTRWQAPVTAQSAGLIYMSASEAGYTRRRAGKGFYYCGPDGQRITEAAVLSRIRALVIPPAWRDVWICPDPDGHLQAVGYDDKGRKQYRYHPRFREGREGAKFDHMLAFARTLPALRERIEADLAKPGMGRDKVAAAVVHLLETTMIRVGNATYARQNKSYGLTTLQTRHVHIDGAELKFHFKGKSGKVWRLDLRDRRVAKVVKACHDLPGQHLFQYLDEHGERQAITSSDINAYLKAASGQDITAKDFRTWAGTVLTATLLASSEAGDLKARQKRLVETIKQVAQRLGNTPAVCRNCYIHPKIMQGYLDEELVIAVADHRADGASALHPEELAVLAFLQGRDTDPRSSRSPRRMAP